MRARGNNRGGTVSRELVALTRELWMWCLERNIHIRVQHLPGVLNVESRTMMDRTDWRLNPAIFRRIDNLLGPIEVDLFASRLTAQCPAGSQIPMHWQRMRVYCLVPKSNWERSADLEGRVRASSITIFRVSCFRDNASFSPKLSR